MEENSTNLEKKIRELENDMSYSWYHIYHIIPYY